MPYTKDQRAAYMRKYRARPKIAYFDTNRPLKTCPECKRPVAWVSLPTQVTPTGENVEQQDIICQHCNTLLQRVSQRDLGGNIILRTVRPVN